MIRILLLSIVLFPCLLAAQEMDLKEAESKLTSSDPELQMKAHHVIGKHLIYSRPDSAIAHFNSSIDLARKKNDLLSEQNATVAIGVAYQIMGLLDTSRIVLEKAREMAGLVSDSMNFGILHNNLGSTLARMGNHQQAIEMFRTAAGFYEGRSEFQRQADALMNIGNSYMQLGYFDLTMEYLNDAVSLCENHNIEVNMQLWNALGLAYHDQKKLNEASKAYQTGLRSAMEQKNNYGIALLSDNLSRVLTAQGNTDSAFVLLDTAWHHASAGQMTGLMVQILRSRAIAYQKVKHYVEARAAINEALTLGGDEMPIDTKAWLLKNMAEYQLEDDNAPLEEGEKTLKQLFALGLDSLPLPLQREYYRIHSSLLSFQGKHEQAFAQYRAYHALNDRIWNTEKANRISELQLKFETQQKNAQITLLQNEKQLTSSRIRNQRYAIFGMACGGVLLLGLGLSGFLLFRQRKRNETLAQNIAARDAERNRLSRELHDGVAGDLFGLQMAVQRSSKVDMANELGRLRDEIRNISHDLAMPDIHNSSLPQMADNLIERHRQSGREVVIIVTPPDDAKWKLPTEKAQHLYRMLQEGLGNALRHTASEDMVKVRLNRTATSVSISIENPGTKDKEPTNGNGNGIGLKNLRERAELIGATVTFGSENDRTTLLIHTPISEPLS